MRPARLLLCLLLLGAPACAADAAVAPRAVPAPVLKPLVLQPPAYRCSLAGPRLDGLPRTTSSEPAGPIYVVDGVLVEPPGSLDDLGVASADTITGPAATAIYGWAGANGVVVITTRGRSTQPQSAAAGAPRD